MITVFFIVFGYYNQLNIYEEKEYERLEALASSVALGLNGDIHDTLMKEHPWRDDISTIDEDSNYYNIHKYLNEVATVNKVRDPLYTIIYDEDEDIFYYGVRSDKKVYFRHSHEIFPDTLVKLKDIGGTLPPYLDENGHWLSAVHPIKNSKGKVVGIVEADVNFRYFINMVREHYTKQALIALSVILILSLVLIPFARKILKEDEKMKKEILSQKQLIELKNRDLTDSINYARKIQEALLPHVEHVSELLPNSFIFYKPRDIVSGDFYWFRERDNILMIAAVDCTGHGIPGALMSMIGHSKLNSITDDPGITDPGKILTELDRQVTTALTNRKYENESKDGMDVALCTIDVKSKKLYFAGAFRSLVIINGDEIKEVKGERFPIGGGHSYTKSTFNTHVLDIDINDNFFMYSDGFPDQFGGPKEKKFMNKRFKQLLKKIQYHKPDEQIKELNQELINWQGENEQVDDVLVIGFAIKNEF